MTVQKGESQIFTITASEGYEIGDVKVDGVSVGAVSSYTFESVTEAHTIAATFTEKAVTLPDSIHEDFNSGDELPEGFSGVDDYEKLGSYLARFGYSEKTMQNLFCNSLMRVVKLCTM